MHRKQTMGNELTSKEYWDQYWTPDQIKYSNYNPKKGLFYSYNMLFGKYIEETKQRLNKKRLRIIDCGCGEGLILRYLAEQFKELEIWGIEYSSAYHKAETLMQKLGLKVNLIKGDILDGWGPELTGSFDMVISIGLIEHFRDPSGIMRQMMNAVMEGGCFLSTIPNFNGLFNTLWKLYDNENYTHHMPITRDRLMELHNSLGLIDVQYYALGSPVIPGLHHAHTRFQRFLKFVIMNLNGRLLGKLVPRQESLEKTYPLHPMAACAGYRQR